MSSSNGQQTEEILASLPPNTAQHPFTTLADYLSTTTTSATTYLDAASSQFILFTNLAPETYKAVFHEGDHSRSIDSYYPHLGLLVVKMKTKTHEAAHNKLNEVLIVKLAGMGHAERGLHETGSAEIKTPSRNKHGDQEYQPEQLPRGRSDHWPTVVIESGYTDSRTTLQKNAQWWLSESKGDVNGVITACIHEKKYEIIFDLWVASDLQTKSGTMAIDTKHSVKLSKTGADAETQAAGAPLILPFESLLLRPPTAPETDVEFMEEDLKYVAESVWDLQQF